MRPISLPTEGQSLAGWVRSTWHAHPSAELISLFSRRQFESALRHGDLICVAPNAYVGACHATSLHSRVDAALLWAGPPVAIGGRAAMCLYGELEEPPESIDIVIPRQRHLKAAPRHIRTRRTDFEFAPVHIGGWPLVPLAMAICQAFGDLGPSGVGGVVRPLASGAVGVEELQRTLDAMPRVRSRRQLASVIAHFAAGSESYLEYVAATNAFAGLEFAQLLRQHSLSVHGRQYRVDLFDAATMTAIETDGAAFHSGADSWQRDLNRDADLASLGVLTLRFSYRDLVDHPERCRQRLRAVLRSRSRTVTQKPRSIAKRTFMDR